MVSKLNQNSPVLNSSYWQALAGQLGKAAEVLVHGAGSQNPSEGRFQNRIPKSLVSHMFARGIFYKPSRSSHPSVRFGAPCASRSCWKAIHGLGKTSDPLGSLRHGHLQVWRVNHTWRTCFLMFDCLRLQLTIGATKWKRPKSCLSLFWGKRYRSLTKCVW